jgi:flavodoxin
MNALIIYHTITGHTRRAAEDVAEGLAGEGATARLLPAGEMLRWDVAGLAIVVVGSPCHAGSLAIRAGVSGAVLAALRKLDGSTLAGMVAGAFSVNSAYGGRRTVQAIEHRLRSAGALVPQAGVVVKAGVPLSLFTGPKASEQCREELRHLGRTLAQSAKAGRNQDTLPRTEV